MKTEEKKRFREMSVMYVCAYVDKFANENRNYGVFQLIFFYIVVN